MVSFCFHKFIQFLCYFIYILENDLPSDDQEEDYFELTFKSLQNTANDLQQFLKQDIEKYDREKTKQSTREHHPEWFEPVYPNEKEDGGINEKFRTKEDYFNNNFENRIRRFCFKKSKVKKQQGIFLKLEDNLDNQLKKKLEAVRHEFHQILDSMKTSRRYFDREKSTDKMCSNLGEFTCKKYSEGEWHSCSSHFLNPYRSRGERVLFGSWSLDHM